jgi:ribonuclease D
MVDRPDVLTRQLTRDALAKLTNSPRTRKALEDLLGDVAQTLPDAVEALAEELAALDASLSTTNAAALQALLLVAAALQAASEGPPPVPIVIPEPDEPAGLAAIRERLAVLEKAVAQLHEGPTP